MTPAIAFGLWREQERLERLGWEFPVWWSPTLREYCVTARQMPSGPTKTLYAATRQELMQEALRWAATAELGDNETRDTMPAPPPSESHAAE